MQIVLSFLVAVQFLTTLPVPLRRQASSEDVGRAVRYFPIVGLWLGVMLASLNWLLNFFMPANIVATLLVASLLAFTGALHFDGFLDSCDGMFGYRTPERRLEIMRDSHVGSFAVAGGWVLLTLKYVALLNIPPDLMTPALLLAPVLGRWALVTAVVIFPYGRDSGLGILFKQHTGKLEMALAGLGVLVFSLLTLRLFGVVLVLTNFVFAYLFGKYVMSKLPAGLTGDSYGAITESSETLAWLIIGAAAGVIKSMWFL